MIHQCVSSENPHSAFYHQKWHNILVSCTSSSNDTYSSGITNYPMKGRLWNFLLQEHRFFLDRNILRVFIALMGFNLKNKVRLIFSLPPSLYF